MTTPTYEPGERVQRKADPNYQGTVRFQHTTPRRPVLVAFDNGTLVDVRPDVIEPALALPLSDLNLCGTNERFYMNPGERVLSIRDNGDGTATVRIAFPSGVTDVIDADIRTTK